MSPIKMSDFSDTDFSVVNEDWSRYLVEDGTTIRLRIVVYKILRTSETDAMGYPTFSIASNNIVSALVPPHLKKTPSKEHFDAKRELGKEMKFDAYQETWQEYHTTEGFKVLLKPVVTKIVNYMKYNVFGEPVYNLPNIQHIMNVEKIKENP